MTCYQQFFIQSNGVWQSRRIFMQCILIPLAFSEQFSKLLTRGQTCLKGAQLNQLSPVDGHVVALT